MARFFSPTTHGGDLAIIHLTFEGIQTFGGGVCTVTRGHLGALPRLQKRLRSHGLEVTPYFLEIRYRDDHPRRDRDHEEEATRALRDMGGEIRYLVNFTRGGIPKAAWGEGDLGTVENWKAAAASGAAQALNIAREHQAALVYCHDSLFSLAPLYMALQAEAFHADVCAIFVAHSTGLTHEMPLPNPERLMAESAGMHWAKVSGTVRIGCVSDFMRAHLEKDYGVRPEHVVPAGNGVNPLSPTFRLREPTSMAELLRARGVPLDRPLLTSWGRPVPYKRFDLVLKAASLLGHRIHPVLVLAEESPQIEAMDQELGTSATVVCSFDPELVATLAQWPRTVAVAAVAENEPCGLIPMEVRMQARAGGAVMVVADSGGLGEQVHDWRDGVKLPELSPEALGSAVQALSEASDSTKEKLRENGFTRVLERYTWSSQILRTLGALLPGMRETLTSLAAEIAVEDREALESADQ
jgi:glycosyltransferase involved in cell wall biosynthesis